LVACGGVSKDDVIEVCSTISSSYADSQLRQGIFKEDPRFRNLLIKLREKQGITNHEYIDILSSTTYNSIALGALVENRSYPNFYRQCIKELSEEFGIH
jgi:hypothetical protein